MSSRINRLFDRYTAFLIRHHLILLLAAILLTIVTGLSASRFTIKTDFAELLPQDEPSIKDVERAKQRKGGLSNMFVVVMGENIEANRKLVDDLVIKFSTLPKDYVVYLKYSINDEKSFYERHKHLYTELEDLNEIHRRLKKKLRYERIKNNPVLSMNFDGEELEPVELEVSDIRDKYEKKASSYQKYIDGYLTGEDGHLFTILLYPPGASTGVDFGKNMLEVVKTAVAEVCTGGPLPEEDGRLDQIINTECPKRYHLSTQVGFAGGVVTAIVEQEAIVADLVLVTCVCLLLVSLVVLLFFRYWRSLPIVGIPLLMGTTWTFGISIYIVEHLNTATAFLAAIILGNGINFGLIQFARYIEERRGGLPIVEALTSALKFTAKATSTAAMAASIAYGSLIITKFRGFNGFGYIGGLGMILCWISSFTVQPAILVFLERIRSMRFREKKHAVPTGLFVRPYARFVTRFGVPLHMIGWAFAAVCVAVTIPYLKDPFEYDFRNLRNRREGQVAYVLSGRVEKMFSQRLDPLFVLADREDQVPLIMTELQRNNTTGHNRKLFDEIKSIYSFLPKDQGKKVKVLNKIRKQLTESTLSWLSDKDREEVEKYKPPADLKPIVKEDLPYALTRMFTELDGRVGLPIALYPHQRKSVWNGHFLIELSDASRLITLPDGDEVTSAGVATIFADMIRAIERDGPRAVVASLLGVMLLVVVSYRAVKFVVLILVALFFGVVWTLGPAAMIDLKLNFLNFIALPITFGIGIDYAVNILNRYRIEGPGSIQRVISNTGGAVALCSLTTIIGYSSLLIADNRALVSFGILADIGEVACLLAAVLLLPALVLMTERRKARINSQRERRTRSLL